MDERKSTVRTYFDEIAAQYEGLYEDSDTLARYPSGPARLQKALTFFQRYQPAGTVLDVGCGTGILARELATRGYDVICMDIAEEMVNKARQCLADLPTTAPGTVSFMVGDFENLDIPDASLDAVAALGVIEYVSDEGAVFSEIRRVLKPGGVAIIAYPNRLFGLSSLNRFTEEEVASGAYRRLLDELRAEIDAGISAMSFDAYTGALAAQSEVLSSTPEPVEGGRLFAPPPVTVRRYTPRQARDLAADVGLQCLGLAYFHFHPFPPIFEQVNPVLYNTLGVAMEALDETPIGACMASAFVAAFKND